MATDDEYKIARALSAHLDGLTTTPATEVAYPNENFKPTAYPYLKANVIPARPGRTTESGELKRHVGIMQVDVVMQKGAGVMQGHKIAGQIIDRFKQSTQIFTTDETQCIQITEPPWQTAPLFGDNEVSIPVQIPYSSFSTVS